MKFKNPVEGKVDLLVLLTEKYWDSTILDAVAS
jgi:hypothetical protein